MPGLDEKRGTQRQPILKAGTISFDSSGIDCLVRNMSDEGANLEVESQIGIPNSFDLVIDSEHSNHQCHVVWRKARRIGSHLIEGNENPAGGWKSPSISCLRPLPASAISIG
jgi:PilZ domain-containing protein